MPAPAFRAGLVGKTCRPRSTAPCPIDDSPGTPILLRATLGETISAMKKEISADGLSAMVEHASRLIHAKGYCEGLNPAQWAALRYFRDTASPSCTIARLAKFQGLSVPTVAKTVQILVEKGYLDRIPNPANKKADQIRLTRRGKLLLGRDPRTRVTKVLESLNADEKEGLFRGIRKLVEGMYSDQGQTARGPSADAGEEGDEE